VTLFTTPKQAFTVSVKQVQVVAWDANGALIYRVENSFQGFPCAENMTVITYWKLTEQAGGTKIMVSGVVNFSGFFMGKDKARRQSIEGIAESCEKMEERLRGILGIAADAPSSKQKNSNAISQIAFSAAFVQQRLLEISANMQPIASGSIFNLSVIALALQVVLLFSLYIRAFFAGSYAHDEL